MEEITIDLIMLDTVKQCQKVLAEWNQPEQKMKDSECISQLLKILDNQSLSKYMETIEKSLIKKEKK